MVPTVVGSEPGLSFEACKRPVGVVLAAYAAGWVSDPRPRVKTDAKYFQNYDLVCIPGQMIPQHDAILKDAEHIKDGEQQSAEDGRRYPLPLALVL